MDKCLILLIAAFLIISIYGIVSFISDKDKSTILHSLTGDPKKPMPSSDGNDNLMFVFSNLGGGPALLQQMFGGFGS